MNSFNSVQSNKRNGLPVDQRRHAQIIGAGLGLAGVATGIGLYKGGKGVGKIVKEAVEAKLK